MTVIDDDDDDAFDDDERKKSKKTNFSSNDRSGHDDQNAYWKRSYPRGVNVRSKFGVNFLNKNALWLKSATIFGNTDCVQGPVTRARDNRAYSADSHNRRHGCAVTRQHSVWIGTYWKGVADECALHGVSKADSRATRRRIQGVGPLDKITSLAERLNFKNTRSSFGYHEVMHFRAKYQGT